MSFTFSRSFCFYVVAFAIAGLTPFLLLPVLTKNMSPHSFGEVTSFVIWVGLLANIAGLCAHGFISVRFYKVDAEKFRSVVFSSIVTVAVAHLIAFILMMAAYKLIADIVSLPMNYALLAVVCSFFVSLNLQCLTIFQVNNRAELFLLARGVQALIELLFCFILLYFFTTESSARIYSYTFAIFASSILGVFLIWRLGCVVVGNYFVDGVELLKFSYPLIPHVLAGTALASVDRLVVSTKLGAGSLGIYMVAMQVGMAMLILIDPLNKSLMPWLFRQLKDGSYLTRRLIVVRTYQLFLVLILAGIILCSVAYYCFDMFVDDRYAYSRHLIPWFVAGFVIQGMYYTQVNYLFYAERTALLSAVTTSIAIIGWGISWKLTSAYELNGAAVSFFVNSLLLFITVWVVSSRVIPMPWKLG
ncbi:lipopolysaccharide biosynthesis protein [Chitinibacter tainanensis]|uniref:lipopolysaccharide biosynthesis protein n=1 Tax=Chitinibacter tainanensis TaxID=230667 RepID=UPI0023528B43|nr:oligosaccharide flippase family protein [Chitinibacter tainanensis]